MLYICLSLSSRSEKLVFSKSLACDLSDFFCSAKFRTIGKNCVRGENRFVSGVFHSSYGCKEENMHATCVLFEVLFLHRIYTSRIYTFLYYRTHANYGKVLQILLWKSFLFLKEVLHNVLTHHDFQG